VRQPAVLIAALAAALALPGSAAADPVPLGQLGSPGTGAGQLSNPRAVAVDGAGKVFVSEATGGDRISVFGPDGGFIHAFGFGVETGANAFEICTAITGCQPGDSGGAAGQLNNPQSLAFDGAGDLYVSDTSNHRISVFDDPGGAPDFVHAFGWGVDTGAGMFEVCTTATTCQQGAAGGGAGQLRVQRGVGFDGDDLYVAGYSFNHRISVFDLSTPAAPAFSHAFGYGVDTGADAFEVCTPASSCQAGLQGAGDGQFAVPEAVALDGAGSLYVADSNHRISVFDVGAAAPTFTHVFGGGGPLFGPSGVALDSSGDLQIAERQRVRISVFDDPAGTPSFVHAFGWGVDTGTAMFEVCTAGCQAGIGGNGLGQLATTGQVAAAADRLYVADALNGRISCFGEPATPPGPCALPAPPPPLPPPSPPPPSPPAQVASALPSNAFALGKLKQNKKKGIAFLFVNVPGPGEVGLAGKGVKNVGIAAATAQKSVFTPGGVVKLRIKPGKGKKARKLVSRLKSKGKAKLKVRVTYVPTGGLANTQARKLKLVRK
jgi:DNA-binding beta-propeller fold protein YncE